MSINSKRKGAKEIWKNIKGYEGLYQVSNLGRIKSLPKYNCKTEKILKTHISRRDGRCSVLLCKNPYTRERLSIHRLVANAFIENPNNLPEINHKDENPKNNIYTNLEWCNRKYNMNYGTLPQRINNKNKKAVIGFNENMQIKLNFIRYGNKCGYDASSIIKSIKSHRKYKGLNWRYCDE